MPRRVARLVRPVVAGYGGITRPEDRVTAVLDGKDPAGLAVEGRDDDVRPFPVAHEMDDISLGFVGGDVDRSFLPKADLIARWRDQIRVVVFPDNEDLGHSGRDSIAAVILLVQE